MSMIEKECFNGVVKGIEIEMWSGQWQENGTLKYSKNVTEAVTYAFRGRLTSW